MSDTPKPYYHLTVEAALMIAAAGLTELQVRQVCYGEHHEQIYGPTLIGIAGFAEDGTGVAVFAEPDVHTNRRLVKVVRRLKPNEITETKRRLGL